MSITSTTFDSVAELTQAPLPAAPSHSRVLGYYAAGDGGGGGFWWDAKRGPSRRAQNARRLPLLVRWPA